MNNILSICILLVLQASLLFSQTPWQDFVNEQKTKADAGDPDAQGILSTLIQLGAASVSNDQAYYLAINSTNASSSFGKYALGRCYELGIGVDKNDLKAHDLFTQSIPNLKNMAVQGNSYAAFLIGGAYLKGRGVDKDETESDKWFLKSAEDGNAFSQYNIGKTYQEGQGVEKDPAASAKWMQLSAENGYKLAQVALGVYFNIGYGVAKDDTEAAKWFHKAAEQGDANAQSSLGFCYQYGKGVSKDDAKALKWYLKAAEQGDALHQSALGLYYSNGGGLKETDNMEFATKYLAQAREEAVKWFRKAAEQGNSGAQNNLGACYKDGKGVQKDITEAIKWFQKSAEQNDPHALTNLGDCYFEGVGFPKDLEAAEKYYRKAISQGFSEAEKKLNKIPSIRSQKIKENIIDAKKRYMEMAIDDAPVLSSGPSKEVIIDGMLPLCSVLENQYKDTSFKIQRGNTQISNGYKGIPIGVEMFPIRLSGSQIQFTYYFYQDEFDDWKIVEK
ncbi:MAG: tetratricopeptide repeat protein [Verrucomicrobia bacterium]|nr:tetratricopeptide repeat protein [Verrucomicrobiota bacterium]